MHFKFDNLVITPVVKSYQNYGNEVYVIVAITMTKNRAYIQSQEDIKIVESKQFNITNLVFTDIEKSFILMNSISIGI